MVAQTQRGSVLTAQDAEASDYFGAATALSADGTVLAVGAHGWDGAYDGQGAVYIYDWSGTAWVQRGAALTAADAGAADYFGAATALSSDGAVLAVGAVYWDGAAGDNQGGVYIYDWSGTAWVQRGAVLTPADAGASDYFGAATALSSDGAVLAVGAHGWDGAAGFGQGGVYIYDWSGTAWVQRGAVLTPADAGASDYFGAATALSSDGAVLAVGAVGRDGAGGDNQGAVYIYDWSGSAWVQRGAALTAADAGAGDQFGYSTALSSDGAVLAVGAIWWEGAAGGQGGVYIYDWSGTAWVQRGAVLTAADAGAGDQFGYSTALSADGTVLVVGAYGWDGAAGSGQGGVYLYDYFIVSGVVYDSAGQPCAREVRIYSRASGEMIATVTSDATTGEYAVLLGSTDEIQRIAVADDVSEGVVYNDIIDRIIPE